ncbi:MAG: efflux RND transporter permease subunit [Gemmatimonadales bacterium]
MSIPSISVRRPVAVWMFFLAVVLLGAVSFVRLPINLLPDVSYPRLIIHASYPEVAPAEVERQVTERIEAAAAGVAGVERVTSVSREGVSLVTLQFAWRTDMDFAMLAVREALDDAREALPESVGRPTILRVDPEADPVMTLSVAGGGDLWRTKELAETVFRRRLEQLDGVARAAVTGGLDREIQVEVDPRLLQSYGLTIADITRALDAANVSAPGGTILEGRYRYPLRTLGEFQSIDEVRRVVVTRQPAAAGGTSATQPASRLVRLDDVADVVDGFAEREAIARYGGAEAVGILVFKEAGANTVAVAEQVEEVLGQLGDEYPEFEVDVASSQAEFIAQSIANVVQDLIVGGLLASLALFLFLRDPRYPAAIALAIPISVVTTFALMDVLGVTLNIMSIGGLALGVGMLVDNSIVVLENISRHHDELGLEAEAAGTRGAEEVQGAITASTLTTIAVFGPIIYVEGVAGELFGDVSFAVTSSLLASLVVALALLPSLIAKMTSRGGSAARAGGPPEPSGRLARWRAGAERLAGAPFRLAGALIGFWASGLLRAAARTFTPLADAFDRQFDRFARWYHARLEWALDRPGRVLAASFGLLALAVAAGTTLPRDFLPDVDQGSFRMRLRLPEGTSLPATAEAAGTLEAAALADPDVAAVFSTIGRDVLAYAEGDEASGLHTATLDVRLRPGADVEDAAGRMRDLGARFGPEAVAVETGRATSLGALLGGTDADVAVRVRSQDLEAAHVTAEEIVRHLSSVTSLGNVRVASERGRPQLVVEIDRTACASFGVDPLAVARTVESAMRGQVATQYVDFDRKIDVTVRYPEQLRYSRATLESLRVDGVPLRELVRVTEVLGSSEIRRDDQARVVSVQADVVEGGLDGAIADIESTLASLDLPVGVRWEVGGENEEMRRSFRDLAFAFGLAVVLIYMILAAQFESFVHPLTVLVSVPLGIIGAVAALLLTGHGLNTMSLIGLVILIGIADNDAIVKIDFVNQARARGLSLRDALLEAGRVRLRPIVITSVTTVLGLLPMAFGLGAGAALRAPLAITVIGGLTVATTLTLVVVPVVYQTFERARERLLVRGPVPEPAPTA